MDFFSLFFLFLCSTLHTSFFKKKKGGNVDIYFFWMLCGPSILPTARSRLCILLIVFYPLAAVQVSLRLSPVRVYSAQGGSLRKPVHLILIEEMLNAICETDIFKYTKQAYRYIICVTHMLLHIILQISIIERLVEEIISPFFFTNQHRLVYSLYKISADDRAQTGRVTAAPTTPALLFIYRLSFIETILLGIDLHTLCVCCVSAIYVFCIILLE